MISEESLAQLRRLMELRDARDMAKKALETAEADYRDAEAEAFEALSSIEGSLKVPLGPPWGSVQFSPRETYFGRVYDEEAAYAHFASFGDVESVAQPKFVMKRINEIVRDCREQGTTPPPGIDWKTRRGVTITRQKGG